MRYMSHFTRHTSHVTRHTSHFTRHTSRSGWVRPTLDDRASVIEVRGLRHPIVENALKVSGVAVVVVMMIMMMVVEIMMEVVEIMTLKATTTIDYRVQAAYVPNDFTLGQDSQSLAVITGPNMGGKYGCCRGCVHHYN